MAGKKILITSCGIAASGELNNSGPAELIWKALPLEAEAKTWGEEVYFTIPVEAELENPVEEVEIGDIACWSRGRAFCFFFGETPISSGGRIVPASAVEVIGKISSGLENMYLIQAGTGIKIERKGA